MFGSRSLGLRIAKNTLISVLNFETIGVGDNNNNNNNNNNKFIQYYHFVQVLPIKITITNS